MFNQMWVTYLKQADKVKGGRKWNLFTAILNVIWAILTFQILKILPLNLNIKIFIFIIMMFPVLLFSIVGFNGENIIKVCGYLYKYMVRPKVLLYKK